MYEAFASRRMAIKVEVLRLATNKRVFRPGQETKEFKADFAFTGSYWNEPRQIMSLSTSTGALSQFKGLIIGSNWHKAAHLVNESFRRMFRDPVSYKRIPLVYRSVKIVIDDANRVTKPWGSINRHVF